MAFGDVLLWLAASATAAAFLIYLAETLSGWKLPALGRRMYGLSALLTTGAAGLLLMLLLSERYDIAYVYGYTSRGLPLVYRISAFWAGPQGSFLLWALIGAWMGVFLARSARSRENSSMVFWCLAQLALLVMLVSQSPFAPLGQPADDGQGLNPILQNPWMAIHPPLLFVGFAAATVAACLAAGALLTGRLGNWAKAALPWASFAWLTLGAGIILGGLWAYEVLGWGGYWGWDPVENSSLVPWITGTVLLHGLILQRRKKTCERPNIIFALLTYLLVLYSTFLTRSGVLGDFSVHSFADLGVTAVLGSMMAALTIVFAGLLVWRWRRMAAPPIIESPDGKESNLYFTQWVLAGIAAFVLIGTSTPVITTILNPERPRGVDAHFYNTTTGPLAAVVLALVALCPLMAWSAKARPREAASPQGRWIGPAVLGALIASAVLFGPAWGMLLTVALVSLLAAGVNVFWFLRSSMAAGLMQSSMHLAHAGFALMFFGIAGSNLGLTPQAMRLEEGGKAGRAYGWTVRLDRVHSPAPRVLAASLSLRSPRGKWWKVQLTGAEMPGGGYAFTPFIHRGPLRDTYFAPEQMEEAAAPGASAAEEPTALANSEEITPAFIAGAAGARSQSAATQDGRVVVNVVSMSVEERTVRFTVSVDGGAAKEVSLIRGETREVDGSKIQFVSFGQMEASEDGGTKVALIVRVARPGVAPAPLAAAADPEGGQPRAGYVSLRVSDKPLMTLMWTGVLIMGIGSLLAAVRRFREKAAREEE